MYNLIPLKYIYRNISLFFLISDNLIRCSNILFIPNFSIPYLVLYLKYSFFFKSFLLLDLGIYEIPAIINKKLISYKNIIWYIFKNSLDNYLFIFSILFNCSVNSIELLFRNAKWLEKESLEFFNIFFKKKKDRRTLFTIPIFYEAPFRKKFPTTGFYELFICFFSKKIKFKHISYKN